MKFYERMKQLRISKGLSQSEIACLIGISQSNYSKYERGEVIIPHDISENVMTVLKEPRLKYEYQVNNKLGILNLPLLDNIDENYITVIDCLIEELHEAADSAEVIKKLLRNKKSKDEIGELDFELMCSHQLQIADVYMALNINFIKVAEQFGLDLVLMEKELVMKYRQKKYYTEI